MESTALPFGQQLLLVILAPPIMAILWRIMARGWAHAVQGETVSETTKQRQKKLFWILLIGLYIFNFGAMIYAHFFMES